MTGDDNAPPTGETLHCLDLFSGLGGFSSAFEDSGHWSVTTVEIEEEFGPDIQADVLELRPDDLPDADLVLASPPCKCFSRAAAWTDHFEAGAPQTVEARESVALVYHTLGLIKAINPRYWFVENPMGSKIKQYLGEPTGSVTYCQYGTTYQKPTYLWGDHPPMTYRWCSAGDDCHEHGSLEDERDERPLPRDPAERAKVPYGLSESIRGAVEEAIDSPQPEQSELPFVTDGGARPGDEDEYVRWSDWSEIKKYREQGKGKVPGLLARRLKVNRIRSELGISKHQAQQRLEHDDDIDIDDQDVDGCPEALAP